MFSSLVTSSAAGECGESLKKLLLVCAMRILVRKEWLERQSSAESLFSKTMATIVNLSSVGC
jgi:hypothetical protein